jgi:hypothetical protein
LIFFFVIVFNQMPSWFNFFKSCFLILLNTNYDSC